MNNATLIYPHQLFEHHPACKPERSIYLVEDAYFFTRYTFHKQKLAFHKATMLEYQLFLHKAGYKVHYIELKADLFKVLKKNDIQELHLCKVVDKVLHDNLITASKKHAITLTFYTTPSFMSSDELLTKQFAQKKKKYYFTSFYHEQRSELNILMVNGKPKGGTFSYDPENRLTIPKNLAIPSLPSVSDRPSIQEALAWAASFEHHPGSLKQWYYPVTFVSAKRWLTSFLHERLPSFGPYQDAIQSEESMLFHSVLSPLLNVGLLTPAYVIEKTLEYAEEHNVPLNSLEGFVRQIIGWREYIYGIYRYHGTNQQKSNFFSNTNDLPATMWSGTTGIAPIDVTIQRILQTGYANHIERLMLLGNFMLLCEINPHQVYHWFMELFIDAYDWVMIPNVYGMSQYADGGSMITKPYFSSSHYIKKMSNYPSGPWTEVFDALCWRFMAKHEKQLKGIPRMRFMNSLLNNMNHQKLKHHINIGNTFLTDFLKGKTHGHN